MTDTRFQSDEWKIIATRFAPGRGRDSESIFALGTGMMGQRANFEETYTGDTLQGSYVAGVYYPDKTVVGWWKVGYPEYFHGSDVLGKGGRSCRRAIPFNART
jgi:maltose phosphorylase